MLLSFLQPSDAGTNQMATNRWVIEFDDTVLKKSDLMAVLEDKRVTVTSFEIVDHVVAVLKTAVAAPAAPETVTTLGRYRGGKQTKTKSPSEIMNYILGNGALHKHEELLAEFERCGYMGSSPSGYISTAKLLGFLVKSKDGLRLLKPITEEDFRAYRKACEVKSQTKTKVA